MIPLIPGRGLYLTMENVVRGDWPHDLQFAMLTLQFARASPSAWPPYGPSPR